LIVRYTARSDVPAGTGAYTLSEQAKAVLRRNPEQDPGNLYDSVSPIDHIARLSAYRKFGHSPFIVVVGQPKADLDQTWHRLAIALGLLCLGVTITTLWMARRLDASAVLLQEDNRLLENRVAIRTEELETKNRALTASERKLSDEQRRLRDFSNSTADWFWEVDEQLKFSYLSESFKSFNGLSAQQLLGMSLMEIYAQETLNPSELKAKGLERFRAREPFRDVEVAYKDEQGEVQWFSASGVPVFDAGGGFAGYRGVAAVITARKRAELALEHNRRLLQELVDSSPYGIGVFDENKECVIRNANYGRILELPQDLLDAKPLRLIDQFHYCHKRGDFADFGLEVPADRVWKILADAESRQSERRLGNGRWVEARVAPVTGGALVTYFDVTNYKEIETELRHTKERLEAAAAAGIVGLWDCDFANGKFYWDSVMYQLYGVREGDFANPRDAFFACIHPDDKKIVEGVFKQAFKGRSNPELDFRIVRPDGAVRFLRGLSRTIFGSDGNLDRMVGVIHDITEQKETLLALEQTKFQAEAASRAKTDFLANISHEIRTPLNAILGMTQVLARSGLNEEQASCLATLESAGQNMLVLLSDVLDLSKIEAGQLGINEIPFSLADVIGSVADTLATSAKVKGLALNVLPPTEAFPTLIGDSIRLGQVLMNLVGNALKFTTQGEVSVSVKTLERSADSIRVRIAVRDTGIGIAPRNLGKLFEPFVQAERSTYRWFGGTGLGLAISKRLVALMGGEIGVDSELGKGSEFWIVVPFKTTSATMVNEAHSSARHGEKRLCGVRLLVVDDTETNREIAVKLLSLEGATCESAESGFAAIERLRAAPGDFDLVLMDVQMPDMDGLEATRVIRHDLELDLPVIALTAGAMTSQRDLALAAGMNGFVAKPFRLRELVATLAPWLQRDATGLIDMPNVGQSSEQAL
jgi:PAS domain S-box-containing protein